MTCSVFNLTKHYNKKPTNLHRLASCTSPHRPTPFRHFQYLIRVKEKLRTHSKQAEVCQVIDVQTWLNLVISLKIIFELELVGKSKSLNLTWFGLIN